MWYIFFWILNFGADFVGLTKADASEADDVKHKIQAVLFYGLLLHHSWPKIKSPADDIIQNISSVFVNPTSNNYTFLVVFIIHHPSWILLLILPWHCDSPVFGYSFAEPPTRNPWVWQIQHVCWRHQRHWTSLNDELEIAQYSDQARP